ncbi:hypothetical protein [Sinomonas atrocyanea]
MSLSASTDAACAWAGWPVSVFQRRISSASSDRAALQQTQRSTEQAPAAAGPRWLAAAPRVESEQEQIQRLVAQAFPGPTTAPRAAPERTVGPKPTPGRDKDRGRGR